jgi:hypothetical protein
MEDNLNGQQVWLGVVVLLASCGDATDSERIRVAANELGIATLETDRYRDGVVDVYEMHALGASGDVLGSVTLRVAPDAELAAQAPDVDNRRADIHMTAGGSELDVWSRAIGLYKLPRPDEVSLQRLLAVAEVAATLEHDVNIVVPAASVTTELAYTTTSCNPAHLLTTPIAAQCCYEYSQNKYTLQFFNETAHTRIRRERSPDGAGCRGPNGETNCSGTACYYGPNGFAVTLNTSIPTVNHFMGTDLGVNQPSGNWCYAYYYTFQQLRDLCASDPWTGEQNPDCPAGAFGDTTGTFARGWGCLDGVAIAPGGGSTCTQAGCGYWDY